MKRRLEAVGYQVSRVQEQERGGGTHLEMADFFWMPGLGIRVQGFGFRHENLSAWHINICSISDQSSCCGYIPGCTARP